MIEREREGVIEGGGDRERERGDRGREGWLGGGGGVREGVLEGGLRRYNCNCYNHCLIVVNVWALLCDNN